MTLRRVRRAIFYLANFALIASLLLLFNLAVFVDRNPAMNDLWAASASMLGTVATLGGLFAAVYFVTLNGRPTGPGNSALRSMYPTLEVLAMLASLSVACIIGTGSILLLLSGAHTSAIYSLVRIQVVFTVYISMLVLVVGLRQIENLDPVSVAHGLLNRTSRKNFRKYRLVEVRIDSQVGYTYELASDGLNYTRNDPLRGFHDLALIAIKTGDRLLLGKLIGELASVTCHAYGHPWPSDDQSPVDWTRRRRRIGYVGKNAKRDQIAVSVHIFHYVRNTAKNNLKRQPGFDVGRHACQYHLARVVACLCVNRDARITIRVALYAILHISLIYSDVRPYGRVEPLNALIVAADLLYSNGQVYEAELAAQILGVIAGRTRQLEGARSGSILRSASLVTSEMIGVAKLRAKSDPTWLPGGDSDDPWRFHY